MQSLSRGFWWVSLLGAAFLAITMGLRQTVGLYVPLLQDASLDIATISLAMALGQLMWGLVQPVAGAMADRYGHVWVLCFGAVMLMVGTVVVPYWLSPFGLMVAFGILAPLGSGAGSFSTLIGVTTRAIPAHQRSLSTGIVNAGGSFGQFTYAPFIQALLSRFGMGQAMVWSGLTALLAIPIAWFLHRQAKHPTLKTPAVEGKNDTPEATAKPQPLSLKRALMEAFGHRDYGLLHLSFFTCGFHVAFLVTHLKVEVVTCHGLSNNVAALSLSLIGLFNIAGSLLAGYLSERMRKRNVLVLIYGLRAVLVFAYLFMPKTDWTFYVFAASLGLTWLATVPPTAGLVGHMFGTRYLATLFGMTLVSHQVGGFFGAFLGGWALKLTGNYDWMWWADIVLALMAALVSLPIREEAPKVVLQSA